MNHRDRHGDNHLTFHGRTIVIDNENAFDTKQSFDLKPPDFPGMVQEALQKDSPSTAASIIATALISRGFVEKLKSATDSEWRLVLKELTTDEFSQFLVRKNNAVSAIRLAESKLGDAIYPVGPFSALSRNPWAAMIARIQEARRDPRVPVDVQNRLRLALDLIETETEFQKPLTVTQRQRIDAALHELETYL